MKKVLTSPMQLWHFVVLAVLMVALTGTAVVSAAPLSSFLAQGTVRMAVASGTASNSITVPHVPGYTNVAVLQQTISVPAGKVADLAVIGEVNIQGGALTGYQYCFGQYRLDDFTTGTQFKPTGSYILEGMNPPPNNLSFPINGYLQNVAAGSHTVYMVISAGYADCIAMNRSMIILANIH